MTHKGAVSTLALLVLLTGCATDSPPKQTLASTGDPVTDGENAMKQAPEKDRVLWQYRTGLTALRRGNYAEAQRLFDDALTRVGGIIGPDKSAKKARSLFSEEAKKTFLGEPYERVMAYFYRGVLYWMNGEPDNARACFRSAQIQDSDTENREYANDWILMDYLDGFVTTRLSGDGSDAYQRAQNNFKLGKLPEYSRSANTLAFFEFGQGPTKYATGEHSEQLHIRPGQSVIQGAWLKVDNKAVRIAPYDDVNFQAMTRGGRVMDHVLANKAVFKSTTDAFGNAAIIGGAVTASGVHGGEEVGLGLIAAGILSKLVSAATTPQADTRTWENLPGYLSFVALQLPLGPHTATVEFTDAAGRLVPSLSKTINFTVTAGNDAVLFASDHNS